MLDAGDGARGSHVRRKCMLCLRTNSIRTRSAGYMLCFMLCLMCPLCVMMCLSRTVCLMCLMLCLGRTMCLMCLMLCPMCVRPCLCRAPRACVVPARRRQSTYPLLCLMPPAVSTYVLPPGAPNAPSCAQCTLLCLLCLRSALCCACCAYVRTAVLTYVLLRLRTDVPSAPT